MELLYYRIVFVQVFDLELDGALTPWRRESEPLRLTSSSQDFTDLARKARDRRDMKV